MMFKRWPRAIEHLLEHNVRQTCQNKDNRGLTNKFPTAIPGGKDLIAIPSVRSGVFRMVPSSAMEKDWVKAAANMVAP